MEEKCGRCRAVCRHRVIVEVSGDDLLQPSSLLGKPQLRQKHVWAIPTKLQAEAIIMQWIDAPLWQSEIPDVSLA